MEAGERIPHSDGDEDAREAKSRWPLLLSVGVLIACLSGGVVLYRDQQQQLVEQERLLAEARKPVLPVRVTYRSAFMGPGLVAVFHNDSDAMLEFVASFTSPGTNTNQAYRLVLGAKERKDVGHLEGWQFAPGHRISLTNAGYRPVETVVPEQ